MNWGKGAGIHMALIVARNGEGSPSWDNCSCFVQECHNGTVENVRGGEAFLDHFIGGDGLVRTKDRDWVTKILSACKLAGVGPPGNGGRMTGQDKEALVNAMLGLIKVPCLIGYSPVHDVQWGPPHRFLTASAYSAHRDVFARMVSFYDKIAEMRNGAEVDTPEPIYQGNYWHPQNGDGQEVMRAGLELTYSEVTGNREHVEQMIRENPQQQPGNQRSSSPFRVSPSTNNMPSPWTTFAPSGEMASNSITFRHDNGIAVRESEDDEDPYDEDEANEDEQEEELNESMEGQTIDENGYVIHHDILGVPPGPGHVAHRRSDGSWRWVRVI